MLGCGEVTVPAIGLSSQGGWHGRCMLYLVLCFIDPAMIQQNFITSTADVPFHDMDDASIMQL